MNYPTFKSYEGVPDGFKRCCKCKEVKPLSEFSKRNDTPDGKRYDCKNCKKKRKPNQPSSNPEQVRKKRLRKNYKMSLEDYDRLYVAQQGKCAICGVHQRDLQKPLFVDHDHTTKDIRGLLCQQCNLGLGAFYDNPDLLIKASEYLWKKKGS